MVENSTLKQPANSITDDASRPRKGLAVDLEIYRFGKEIRVRPELDSQRIHMYCDEDLTTRQRMSNAVISTQGS